MSPQQLADGFINSPSSGKECIYLVVNPWIAGVSAHGAGGVVFLEQPTLFDVETNDPAEVVLRTQQAVAQISFVPEVSVPVRGLRSSKVDGAMGERWTISVDKSQLVMGVDGFSVSG